jgi:hypothetical protein
MSVKRHLNALLHREQCDRGVLIPLVEKMTEQEARALWGLLQHKEQENHRLKRIARRGF